MAANDANFKLIRNEKAKAPIWNHFKLKKENEKVVPNIAVCDYCNESIKYSGGTTNLASHMRRHHGNVDVNVSANQSKQKSGQCQAVSTSSTPQGQVTLAAMMKGGFGAKYSSKSPRASGITEQIARLIIKDLRPYSMVEGCEFVRLIKLLDPRYTIPGRKQFSEIIIPKMYSEEQLKLKMKIKNAEKIALTTDGWTSRSTDSFVTITAVFLDKDWSLQNFVLQTRVLSENHTGENLAQVLRQAVEDWGLPSNPNPPIVTDNASNMERAGILFEAEHHIKCYAHTLNLAAQKSLKVKQVSHILARMRKIVSFFHRSSVATAKLREQAHCLQLPSHKLLIDVPTRWNSAYDMVSRFLEMQCAVTTVLRMKEISKFRDKDINSFTDEDLAFAEDVMECLKPLKTVTTSLCTESMPTISVIMPIQHTLLRMMQAKDDDSNGVKQMKNTIVQDLKNRYDHQKDLLTLASFLDPRFKSLPFLGDDSLRDEVYANVINKLVELGPMKIKKEPEETTDPPLPSLPMVDSTHTTDDSTGIKQVAVVTDSNNNSPERKKVKKEDLASLFSDVYVVSYTPATEKSLYEKATENIEVYKSLSPAPFHSDPLQWWKIHDSKCPLLASLAKSILAIPATSVASERIFSTAGDIVNSQRACLKPAHVDMLIFLKKNLQ